MASARRPKDSLALFRFGRLPYCSGALGVGVPARPIGRASNERPLREEGTRLLSTAQTSELVLPGVRFSVATSGDPRLSGVEKSVSGSVQSVASPVKSVSEAGGPGPRQSGRWPTPHTMRLMHL